MAEINTHQIRTTDQLSVNGATVETGRYNIGSQRVCKVRIEAYIVDTVSGNYDIGEFVIAFRRFGNGAAIIRTVTVIPFVLPGTLAGASVSSALVTDPVQAGANTIVTRFTGVAGRTIQVVCKFSLETIQN